MYSNLKKAPPRLKPHGGDACIMKRPFQKPPLTLEEQITLLKERGLLISNEEEAKAWLRKVHYSRLRPYWHPFEEDHKTHRFVAGTTFSDVVELYDLDRRLRLLALEAIERFEVALRSLWAYEMAHAAGSFAYTNLNLHFREDWHKADLQRLLEEWKRASEHDPVFRHYKDNYDEPYPPIWLVVESVSLGILARFIANLKDPKVSKSIAGELQLPHSFLKGAVKHLVVVRNIAAHHGRFWDREFSAYALPSIRKNPRVLKEAMDASLRPQSVYRTLALLAYIMERLHPEDNWKPRLHELLKEFRGDFLNRMGFPSKYRSFALWS